MRMLFWVVQNLSALVYVTCGLYYIIDNQVYHHQKSLTCFLSQKIFLSPPKFLSKHNFVHGNLILGFPNLASVAYSVIKIN